MSAENPWMKFYPQDWRADEKLRLCGLAARGLWIEMLAIMHRSERYGQLLISGRVPTDAQLAVQVGASPDQVAELIRELEEAEVFSRAAKGVIYSRRMTRDHRKAKTARENGKNGGNPNLSKTKGNSASDKGKDKASDKGGLKPQKPEARDQKEKEDSTAPEIPRAIGDATAPFHRIMQACRLTRPLSAADRQQIEHWRSDGIDLDKHIIPVAGRIAAREADRGKCIGSMKYLDAAVREAFDEERRELEHYREIAERYGSKKAVGE